MEKVQEGDGCENIVKYFGGSRERQFDVCVILMEYCESGNLLHQISQFLTAN